MAKTEENSHKDNEDTEEEIVLFRGEEDMS
jgi:hypothetical protein